MPILIYFKLIQLCSKCQRETTADMIAIIISTLPIYTLEGGGCICLNPFENSKIITIGFEQWSRELSYVN